MGAATLYLARAAELSGVMAMKSVKNATAKHGVDKSGAFGRRVAMTGWGYSRRWEPRGARDPHEQDRSCGIFHRGSYFAASSRVGLVRKFVGDSKS